MLLARPPLPLEDERGVDTSDPVVPELVQAALDGSRAAWDELVERFSPLVLSITRRYRLSPADAADVSQTVWLQLVQKLSSLREPRALPGWIATTVRHECTRVWREQQRTTAMDPQEPNGLMSRGREDAAATDAELLLQERHEALLAGFAELTPRQRELLLLLLSDPPSSYAEISARLGIPVGAIGPTRARALDRLRHTPALAALLPNALSEAEVS